jgi:hypothetical protein
MLSKEAYIQLSLEFNLFWVRVMKEHAIFIESSIPPTEKQLADRAAQFNKHYEGLLSDTIKLANGSVSRDALQSGQYYTGYTEEAERIAAHFTGIDIDRELTRAEYGLVPYDPGAAGSAQKEQEVSALNQNILNMTNAFAQFKAELLGDQTACRYSLSLYRGSEPCDCTRRINILRF